MNTYQINITLEIDAVNDRAAKRLAQLVGSDIEHGRRRPGSPGASGIAHAWLDAQALPSVERERFPVGTRVVEIAYPDRVITGHAPDGWRYARSVLTEQTLSFAPHELALKETN